MNLKNNQTKLYINSDEAAALLGIHKASIRNWIRHGYLRPINQTGSPQFLKYDVESLKQQISSGSINRLNNRANKSTAAKTFVPEEYSSKPDAISFVSQIAEYIKRNQLDIKSSLYYLTLNVLHQNKAIELLHNDNTGSHFFNTKNRYLHQELLEWKNDLPQPYNSNLYNHLLKLILPIEEDVLGFIYQSVLAEGSKAKQGSYYTPNNIVLSIMNEYLKPGLKLLDPCCGTGRFLLTAASLTEPINIYGFDIDDLAVRISRINLMIKFKHIDFKPNIYCYNSLLDLPAEFEKSFDLITTNPPWGMHINNGESVILKKKYTEINSGESFSYFLRKGTDLLKEGGVLSFLLPEAVLYVKTHKDIRKYILDNYSIGAIHNHGQIFKNVFTKVIRLDLKKVVNINSDSDIRVTDGVNSFFNSQNSLYTNPDYRFSFHQDDNSRSILEKVYSIPHTTLNKQAEWALGIVTGNNKKYLSPVKLEGYEEVYTGREVSAYNLKTSKNFIKFLPELFQQVAPEVKYRAKEKLIYKFISNRLVVAYDDQQKLTLNSANILIPKIPEYPVKTILALLNSSVYQFIFNQKFKSIKVLRSHLESLPFPLWDNEIHKKILSFVDLILNGVDLREELDQYILALFKLSGSEMDYIRNKL